MAGFCSSGPDCRQKNPLPENERPVVYTLKQRQKNPSTRGFWTSMSFSANAYNTPGQAFLSSENCAGTELFSGSGVLRVMFVSLHFHLSARRARASLGRASASSAICSTVNFMERLLVVFLLNFTFRQKPRLDRSP